MTTPHLGLPLIAAAQAQKHVTHNEALVALDALVQLAVIDRTHAAPPGAPVEGDRYIVAGSPTGAWAGHAKQVALWHDSAWTFYVPQPGWTAFVVAESVLVSFDGAAWSAGLVTVLQNLALLGIGTTADATNPFSTKLNNVLHTAKTVAEGGTGNIQVKLSKESAAKTASCLFQTNFSGRAEFGLVGNDDLTFKQSLDGSTFAPTLTLKMSSSTDTRLGVGATVTSPGAALHVEAPTSAVGWFLNSDPVSAATAGAGMIGYAGATPTGADHRMAFFLGGSRVGGVSVNSAGIEVRSSQAWTVGSAQGTYLQLMTTQNGQASRVARTVVDHDGTLRPAADNAYALGSASFRWSSLFLGTFTVAGLPAAAAGACAFASNGRAMTGSTGAANITVEGAGAGTGCLVTYNGSAWKIAGTNATVTA